MADPLLHDGWLEDECVKIRGETLTVKFKVIATAGQLDPPYNKCYRIIWVARTHSYTTWDCLYPVPEDTCKITITTTGDELVFKIVAKTHEVKHKNWKIVVVEEDDGLSTSHLENICRYSSHQNLLAHPRGSRYICPDSPMFPDRDEHGVLDHKQFAEWFADNGLKVLYNEGHLGPFIEGYTTGPFDPGLPNGGPIQQLLKEGKCKLE